MKRKTVSRKKIAPPKRKRSTAPKKVAAPAPSPPVPVPQPSPPTPPALVSMQWPMQYQCVVGAIRTALLQCNPEEASTIAEYMLDTGIEILSETRHRQLLLVVQDAPMHRLLNAIAAHAHNSKQEVNDVVGALITKLGPDGVEDARLN